MTKRLIVLGILFLCLFALAGSAGATCIKCDQTTGYYCFISTDGRYANCDSPTYSGCVLWGSCGGSGGCGDQVKRCPYQQSQLWSEDYKLASVTVSNAKSGTLVTVSAGHEVASR